VENRVKNGVQEAPSDVQHAFAGRAAVATLRLIALTDDESFAATLHGVVSGEHALRIVDNEPDLTDSLLGSGAAVALLDAPCCVTPVTELTSQLKSQFPDIVLVVAGSSADQTALAGQVTDGTVYRFLHKPVSEQRVKLFVDAALRRHEEHGVVAALSTRAGSLASPPLSRHPPRNTLPLAALGVAALALLAWLMLRAPATPVAPVGTQHVAGAVAADPRLLQASQALERGDLVAPPGKSAADLYAAVLADDPKNAAASDGREKVIDRLLSSAEQALIEERIDDAVRLVDSARKLAPQHMRVAFLTTQIAKERERALLSQARAAAATGNYERALAVLSGDRTVAKGSAVVAEARLEFEQQQIAERVRGFLKLAGERLQSGALIEPPQNNASFYLESARALAPNDPAVRQTERTLGERILAQASAAATAKDIAAAERWLQAAEDQGASRTDIAAIRRGLQHSEVLSKGENITRLGQLFNERIEQNRLLEPANDSAKYYVTALQQADPQHPVTQAARQKLAKELLDEAHGAIDRSDLSAAGRWIGEAQEIGASGADVSAAQRDLAAASERAAHANDVVGASTLQRVRYVEPRYPESAMSRRQSGWVELEFTVHADGSVGDVTATQAEPAGVFEAVASEALSKWRFKPVLRNGAAVEQRARVRVRFSAE
jgi:TonB family protein